MTVRQLCCQGCGAVLPVKGDIRFLTCNYCHAHLEIVGDQASTHTRILEGLEQRTKKIEKDVEVLRVQGDLRRLDEAWAKYEARVDPKDDKGRRTGTVGAAVILGLIVVACGVTLLLSEAWWLGLIVLPAGLWLAVKSFVHEMKCGQAIEGMRLEYEVRRRALLQRQNGGK